MSNLTLGSLFDGSGGFPLAGMMAGITPIWASEIEPFSIRVTTKRIPQMKHYGDISKMNGGKIEPVDIITFGSPCQNLSLAGKREGLNGEKSSMFFEAIRVIKEMRENTNGEYPRWIVWENVPGAMSSSKGQDFRTVLEEICKIKDKTVHIPMPEKKWTTAGEIVGNDYSVAYRILDAQYFGVPQRRRRIFLVADFAGECAGKVLFESESVFGNFKKSLCSRQGTAGTAETGIGETGTICLNDQGGERIDVTQDKTTTLRAQAHHPPCVMFENHSQDTRYIGPLEVSQTVLATFGTGGNNQPFVVHTPKTLKIRCGCDGSGFNQDTSFTLNTVDRHAVAYGIDRAAFNQGQNALYDFAIEKEKQPTMVAKGPGAVAEPAYSASKASFFTSAEKECANTLVASDYKDPPLVNDTNGTEYIVRRLTPKECALLQGFPVWWCDGLETENPTEEEIQKWSDIFENHRKALCKSTKPKTRNQIIKWLKNPHSDSAEYTMWGNGVALPCVFYVLNGIAHYAELTNSVI